MTIAYSAMKILGACKYINHSLIAIFDVGKGGMLGCIEEGIFYAEFMRKVEGEEVGAACVASRATMRTKHCLEFFTIATSDFGIDVSTDDEVGIFWDLLEE